MSNVRPRTSAARVRAYARRRAQAADVRADERRQTRPSSTRPGSRAAAARRTAVSTTQPAPPSPNQLLTIPEAARYLNVPVRWVQDAVGARRIRCTRIGKHVRFTLAHLNELIESGEQPVTATTQRHRGGPRSCL